MAENPAVDRSLKDLLNGLQKSQKTDIKAYAGGYLNEAKLYKPPRPVEYKQWDSSKKGIPVLLKKSVIPTKESSKKKESTMKETLKHFTFGANSSPTKERSPRKGTKGPVALDSDRLESNVSSQGSYSKLDDGVLVESMGAGETMIVNTHYPRPKSWMEEGPRPDSSKEFYAQGGPLRDMPVTRLHHKFVPNHLQAITKRDQYKKMVNFESAILRKQDTLEQNIMSGVKAAEHLEDRLQKVNFDQ